MLFNSLEFLILFLPAVYVIARLLKGNALLFWISLASFVFYAFAGHAWFLIPMAITTTLDYWVGRRLVATRHRRAFLLVSVIGNLGLLFYFKYSPLAMEAIRDVATAFGFDGDLSGLARVLEVTLPAGISFYTFQTLAYVIDIYRGESEPERNFLKYVAFVTFFPHLVAGPLTRHDQLLPQLGQIGREGFQSRWEEGIYLFAIGLAKKVLIADRVAALIDPVIATLPDQGMVGCWIAMLGYAVEIYFDFSGYSDMAIGLGRLFGIELPQNFDSPYQATNPSDFWRRWHITLSRWLRDYLYISLGGNRVSPMRTRINLMITMVLGGLWHGASWNFAVWGAYHGVLLVLHQVFEEQWKLLPRKVQQFATFLLVCVGWIFFRSTTMATAVTWLEGLVGMRAIRAFGVGFDISSLAVSGLLVFALALAMFARNALTLDLRRLRRPAIVSLAILTVLSVLLMNYSSKFLYFQF